MGLFAMESGGGIQSISLKTVRHTGEMGCRRQRDPVYERCIILNCVQQSPLNNLKRPSVIMLSAVLPLYSATISKETG